MTALKTDILLELGKKDAMTSQWPDYLQYGFEESDIENLLNIVGDESLLDDGMESDKAWAPVHAWRAIGQLGSDKAIAPLIDLFDELVEDDLALSELPVVFGMIGKSSIEPLTKFFNENEHDEYARAMASDGLCKIAEHWPDKREEVLLQFRDYLNHADQEAFQLNGLVIANLLDLNAKELIEEIRELFKQQCVDISCAGDLEEIEIQLEFRDKRSTPPPSFSNIHNTNINSVSAEDTDSDDLFAVINQYLAQHGQANSISEMSELDGFFTALACSPCTIMPSVWMAAIWGGEEYSPDWSSPKEFETFGSKIFNFYNNVIEAMADGEVDPIYVYVDHNGESVPMVDKWCMGFMRGINLWGDISPEENIILDKALRHIRLFSSREGLKQLSDITEEELLQHQNGIEPAVKEVYSYFAKKRIQDEQPAIRATPKIGRNNPCPCGSGKKYKKCCLH